MRVLALDSAFGGLSAAVAEGPAILASLRGAPDAKAAESLPGLVSDAMTKAGLRLTDLDRIATTLGPGGFTSLRAGLAFAKGLAMGARKPLLGFTTLEALATCAPHCDTPVVSAIDAKREELFVQVFAPDLRPLSDAATVSLDDVRGVFTWPQRFRVCGSGAALLAARVAGGVEVLDIVTPDAAVLARHCQAFTVEARPAQAVYLRPADARPMA